MADRQLNYEINLNVNKASLSKINSELDKTIKTLNQAITERGPSEEFSKSVEAAKQLKAILNSSWKNNLNQLDLKQVHNQIEGTFGSIQNLKTSLADTSSLGANAYNEFSKAVLNTNLQLSESSKLLDSMADTMAKTIKWGIASRIMNNMASSIEKAWSYSVKLDSSLNDIRIVTGKGADEMERFAVTANKAAKSLGASTRDYTEASLIYYQQGLSDQESQKRAEITLKTANVTAQSAQDVSEQLTAIWNGYKVSSEEAELYIDKVAAVAADTAADLEELATGMSKVASAANLMGVDVDQLNAQLATVVSVTRQAPESVGVAFKTIYARMGDIEAGLDEETTLGNYTSKMAALGVNVLDANGKLRDMGEVIEEIGNNWQNLTREQQINLSQTMAGVRQYNNLLALFDNWGMYTEALETSANAAGTLQKQQDIYMESTEAHLQQMRTEAERTYDILFDTKTVNSFIDAFTGLNSVFNTFLKGLGGGMNDFVYFGSLLTNIFSNQLAAGINNTIQNFNKFIDNKDKIALMQDIVNAGPAEGGTLVTKNTQADLNMAKDILLIQRNISNEEFNELNTLRQKITITNEILAKIDKEDKITEETIGNAEKELGLIQQQADKFSNLYEIEKESGKDLQARYNVIKGTLDLLEDEINYQRILNELEEARATGDEEKQDKLLRQAELLISNKRKNKAKEIEVLTENLGKGKEEIKELGNEAQEAFDKKFNADKTNAKISTIIAGVSVLTQSLTALSGIVKTIGDDSLSSGEKISQVLTSLGAIATTVAFNWNNLKDFIPMLKGLLTNPKVAIVAAVVASIAAIIWKIVEASQAAEKEINNLRKASEELKKESEQLGQKVNDVSQAFEKYKSVEDTLNKCIEGSDAWNEALKNVNKTVLEILDKYPALAKTEGVFSTNPATGQISLNEKAVQDYLNKLQKQEELTKLASLSTQLMADEKANALKRENLVKNMTSSLTTVMQTDLDTNWEKRDFQNARTSQNATVDSQKIRELLNGHLEDLVGVTEQEYKQRLKSLGIEEKYINSLIKYQEQINQLDIETEKLNTQIKNTATAVAASKYGNQKGTLAEQFLYGKQYEEEYKKQYDELLEDIAYNAFTGKGGSGINKASGVENTTVKDWLKAINEIQGTNWTLDKNPVRGNDKNRYLAFRDEEGNEKIWSAQQAASVRAAATTESSINTSDIKKMADDIKTKLFSGANGISDELADTLLSSTFDSSSLNESTYNNIKSQLDKIEENFQNEGLGEKVGASWFANFKEGFQKEWDKEAYEKALVENFKNTLSAAASASAEQFKLEEEDLKNYGQYLADIADESDELADSLDEDGEAANTVARSIMRMDRAIETLADNWENWRDILENSTEESEEYWRALSKMQETLGDLLDVNKEAQKYFSDDFIKKYADSITQAAEGSGEAIDYLRDKFADEVILRIGIENKLDDSIISDLSDLTNNLQDRIPDIEVGYSITGDGTAFNQFLQECQKIVKNAQMTAEQANAFFASMGFDAEFAQTPIENETTRPVVETNTYEAPDPGYVTYESPGPNGPISHRIKTVKTITSSKVIGYDKSSEIVMVPSYVTKTPDGQGRVPKVTKLTKKGTGNFNNFSSRNAGGGSPGRSGGGGGGSSKQPSKIDPVEKEKDRYHDVNIQLKQISNELDKLDKQKDKLFGNDLIENLNKQLELLNKQIDTTNEKMKIAEGEAQELQGKLTASGVTFNADGTIGNYAQAYQAQLNYVNGIINQYNSMGAEAQEGFKDTVENAKENFEKFVENINRYDEVITDLIPGLTADIQEAVDKQIDIQIEEFDMEIEIRLDMAEAERDWNEFKKKIIDGIKDDDILGNAMANLVDFSSYYKEDDTGAAQALRKQIDNTLKELYQMDETGTSRVYGDNRTAALEDLKKYYDELRKQMQDILKLQEEIHQSYIDMMDEAQDKFDEQVKSYEMISKLVEHDKKVISMVYGEDAYRQLSAFYDKQELNYKAQLDFQKQQTEFWKEQMEAAEAGSEAWDEAKEKWVAATEELNSLIETSIENLEDKYLNAINAIFQDLNDKVTSGAGLDYVEEEWNLINKNAEQYLDNINRLYGIQALENKYLDAINDNDNIAAQRQLKRIMDEELKNLRERDKLTEYDIERANKKYEIALKQIALEEAQQNKTQLRLRRDTQGNYRYEFISDIDQVNQLQNDLDDLYNSLYNFDKENYTDNLNQLYDVWKEFQDKMAEAAQINDPQARAERELLIQEQYGEMINGLVEQNETIRGNLYDSAFEDLARLYDKDKNNFLEMTQAEQDALMNDLIPYWDAGVQHMADVFAGEGGFIPTCEDAIDELHEATKEYEDGLKEVENTANISFDNIGNGIDDVIDRTQELLKDNDDLINSYREEMDAIGGVVDELDNLVNKYQESADAAKAAEKAAYDYWSEQQRQAAEAAARDQAEKERKAAEEAAKKAAAPAPAPTPAPAPSYNSGGDGVPRVGDEVNYVNGRYTADSYGGGSSGAMYLGGRVRITIVKEDGRPRPIHIATLGGGPLGWVSRSQITGYDTGGYTGEWGNTGRLALLHQKELVLNQQDTKNLLNAVNVMRMITNNIGNKVLDRLNSVSASGGFNGSVGGILDQNVNIQATFPNVKDHNEIEEALNNLVNRASQFVQNKER